ncbi:MAG: fibronectin type III domain-containing protein, partial [Candidatus Sumerlaeota bacterium]|nr:fibronectin type III domain-containing protein [Candidatus Sumerlaeota bacterium]
PEFAQRQTVHLTGLTSSTVYFVQATLHDQAGNGPLVSPVLRFETLGANDTAPPVITGGPMAVDVTDTGAAIEWTTNEPATSGVSYNDGTVYGVAQDDALTLGHSVPLSGLTPATTYHCVVSSTDAAGNGPTLSETFDFRTLDAPVTDGPRIIEGPYALGITHKSALIKWTTDRPADSVVEYGLWPTLDRRAAVARMSRNHVVHLTRLQSDARHAFRVSSTDASGGAAQSETLDFYTRASGDPHSGPKILDGPSVIYCGDTEATIAWETNTPCDSVVYYGIDPDLSLQQSDPRPVKRHVVTLAGLEPGQSYVFQVTSTDGSGATVAGGFGGESPAPRAARLDAAPGESGFNTETDPDTQPPAFVVAPTVSDRSATMAVVRWTTDEPADTRVAFGPAGQARDRFAGDPAMDMEHLIVVTRLSPSTNYDLVAASRDAAGNERQSPVLHFSTTAAPDSAAPLFVSGPSGARVSRTQALIQWGTNEHSTSIVEYGLQPDRLDFQESAEGLHTDHAVDLTDLAQDTLYYYRAVTVDPSGNRAQSGILAFSTANSARRWSEYP